MRGTEGISDCPMGTGVSFCSGAKGLELESCDGRPTPQSGATRATGLDIFVFFSVQRSDPVPSKRGSNEQGEQAAAGAIFCRPRLAGGPMGKQ